MFGKLLKHEGKATGRILGPVYAGFVVLVLAACGMLRVTAHFGTVATEGPVTTLHANTWISVLSGLLCIAAVLGMVAVVIVTDIVIIARFYRLLGDDGYFWFSLPVTPAQHMAAKLLVAMLWSVVSVMLFIGGMLAFVLQADNISGDAVLAEVWDALCALTAQWPMAGFAALFVLAMLASVAAGTLQVQLACALGMRWPQSRLGASIGMYVVISVVVQVLVSVGTIAGGALILPNLMTLTAAQAVYLPLASLGLMGVWYLALSAVYFFATHWLLTKRLNLV